MIKKGRERVIEATFDGARAGKPLVFFGNTVSGVAALLGLDRLCPFAGNE